ncbi:hypothetical protein BD779DRAFT_1667918 [Infundibulicybe gibba]|nr:hypothetical protein BD779DRAFT_1667918 [Infundibulicybe gibba]
MATQYQKSAPNPPPPVVPATAAPFQNGSNHAAPPPPPAPPALPAPSAPMSVPSAAPNATNTASNTSNGTPSCPAVSTSPPVNTASSLCDNCHLRPKHFDGTMSHPFCSKTCANKFKNLGPANGSANGPVNGPTNGPVNGPTNGPVNGSTNGSSMGANNTNGSMGSTNSNSGNCDIRPKHHDGMRAHPYCSKACAKSFNSQHKKSASTGKLWNLQAHTCQRLLQPGAQDAWGDPLSDMPQGAEAAQSHFCSQACSDDAEKKGPMILEVPQVIRFLVAEQFKASWRHSGTTCPPVRRVYKILAPQASLANYNTYRDAVEVRGQFVAAGRSAGNENRRWHGTRRECNLGDKGQTDFCTSSTCSLCCIMKTSFDLSLWGKKTGWGRFGKGIYTSSTSSKSNDYSQNTSTSPLKAMLLNKVIVGRGCKLLHDNTTLTTPPPGYDSVLAERGGSLNYDELVVYVNDAIRPSFLVMYEP